MNRQKAGVNDPVRSSKIQLRLRASEKELLARAAKLRGKSLSRFMLEHAYEAAQQVLCAETDITLSAAQWKKFCIALDSPPRPIAALKKLLTTPSVFDGPRNTST